MSLNAEESMVNVYIKLCPALTVDHLESIQEITGVEIEFQHIRDGVKGITSVVLDIDSEKCQKLERAGFTCSVPQM